jgi:hypothetical protein
MPSFARPHSALQAQARIGQVVVQPMILTPQPSSPNPPRLEDLLFSWIDEAATPVPVENDRQIGSPSLPSGKRRSLTPSNQFGRKAVAAESDSTVGTLACTVEGCVVLSRTPSDQKKHVARHHKVHLCKADDCVRAVNGFATASDLNRHLVTVHKLRPQGARIDRCFGSGCNKFDKDWPRRYNFKAHLRKAHPTENLDELLRRSETWWDKERGESRESPSRVPVSSIGQTANAYMSNSGPVRSYGESENRQDQTQNITRGKPRLRSQADAPLHTAIESSTLLWNPAISTEDASSKNINVYLPRPIAPAWNPAIAAQQSLSSERDTLGRIQLLPIPFLRQPRRLETDEGYYSMRSSKTSNPDAPFPDSPSLEVEGYESPQMAAERLGKSVGSAALLGEPALTSLPSQAGHILGMPPQLTPIEWERSHIQRDCKSPAKLYERVSEFDSLKMLVASFKGKVSNSLELTAVRAALKVLENVSTEVATSHTTATLEYTAAQKAWFPSLDQLGDKSSGAVSVTAEEIADSSEPRQESTLISPSRAWQRSPLQSSEVGSHASEGEVEFVTFADDHLKASGVSPGSASSEDYFMIASTVEQLVTKYLRLIDFQTTSSRQRGTGEPENDNRSEDRGSSSASRSTQVSQVEILKCGKRIRQDDDDGFEDRGNPPKRIKVDDGGVRERTFACPYAKHNKTRYSKLNTDVREKTYRRCESSYLKDISRLKQHLYRTHKRPDSYCGRCFGTFRSQNDLEEHSRTHPPCPVDLCPFPEKMTHDQKTVIRRRGDGKDPVTTWFFIYGTLFPESSKPSSPYTEIVSNEAAANFRQWYETPEAVVVFRENFESRIAEAFPNSSDQFWIQMIHEECLSELSWRRGPNFHLHNGVGRLQDSSPLLPSSGSASRPFTETGISSNTSNGATADWSSLNSHQDGLVVSSFLDVSRATPAVESSTESSTKLTTQESVPPLDVGSLSESEIFGGVDRCDPYTNTQGCFAFETMASGQELDFHPFPGQGILTLITSDAEDAAASAIETEKRGKRVA